MKTKLNERTWTTYRQLGYTYDVANDQASAGGVHLHQVRKTAAGWQHRILQSNGQRQAAGPVDPISDEEGEACFTQACQD